MADPTAGTTKRENSIFYQADTVLIATIKWRICFSFPPLAYETNCRPDEQSFGNAIMLQTIYMADNSGATFSRQKPCSLHSCPCSIPGAGVLAVNCDEKNVASFYATSFPSKPSMVRVNMNTCSQHQMDSFGCWLRLLNLHSVHTLNSSSGIARSCLSIFSGWANMLQVSGHACMSGSTANG